MVKCEFDVVAGRQLPPVLHPLDGQRRSAADVAAETQLLALVHRHRLQRLVKFGRLACSRRSDGEEVGRLKILLLGESDIEDSFSLYLIHKKCAIILHGIQHDGNVANLSLFVTDLAKNEASTPHICLVSVCDHLKPTSKTHQPSFTKDTLQNINLDWNLLPPER